MKKNDFVWVEDLIFYDGPLLSLLQHTDGSLWLMYWVDINLRNQEDWLVFDVTQNNLALLREKDQSKAKTLRAVIDEATQIYEVKTSMNGEWVTCDRIESAPEHVKPAEGFYLLGCLS